MKKDSLEEKGALVKVYMKGVCKNCLWKGEKGKVGENRDKGQNAG